MPGSAFYCLRLWACPFSLASLVSSGKIEVVKADEFWSIPHSQTWAAFLGFQQIPDEAQQRRSDESFLKKVHLDPPASVAPSEQMHQEASWRPARVLFLHAPSR